MCIRVQYASLDTIQPWDAARRVINLPSAVAGDKAAALRALRRTLRVLDVEQGKSGARCWCGDPIRLPRIPQQRRSDEVNSLGA